MTLSEIHNEESVTIVDISLLSLNLYRKNPIPSANPSVNVEPLPENQKQVLACISTNHKCEQLAERTRKNRDTIRIFLGVTVQNITYLIVSESQRMDIGLLFRRMAKKLRKKLECMNRVDAKCLDEDGMFCAINIAVCAERAF